jgi:ferredoxin, 2Fe-2S
VDPARLGDVSVPMDAVAIAPAEPAVAPAEAQEVAPAPSDGAAGPAVADLPGPGGQEGKPRITFVLHDGAVHSVDVPVGLTVMDGSVRNNLPGIIAECGGMCSCGTCHIYVVEEWRERLPAPEFEEEDLLEFIADRQDGSRLSCQLVVTDDLDGLVVQVPQFDI